MIKPRETILDRIVSPYDGAILCAPELPPLCDGFAMDKRNVDIDSTSLYCEQDGDGIPIILINGGPGGTHHCFHPYFIEAASFAKIIYYDQRGCGRSGYDPGDGYTVMQAVDDLEKLRTALGISKWIVLGYSYGGTLARLYANIYPENVYGVALVSSSFAGLSIAHETGGTRQYDFLTPEERERIRNIHSNSNLSLMERVFNAMLCGDWKRQAFYKPTVDEVARIARYEWIHDGDEFCEQICDSMDALNESPDDNAVLNNHPEIPVLLMEGKWDLTWQENKAEKLLSCFTNARMVMFERSGHTPFMDELEKFMAELKEFVSIIWISSRL